MGQRPKPRRFGSPRVSVLFGIVKVNGLFVFIRRLVTSRDGWPSWSISSPAVGEADGWRNAPIELRSVIIQTLHTDRIKDKLLGMARGKPIAKTAIKPRTVQRTYRFDTKLFEAFEDDCARHLSNPKRVIEAMILHWLDADPNARAAMAQVHRERVSYGPQDE